MNIEAFHRTTGERVVLTYDTLKEAIARTSHYLRDYAIIDIDTT